MSGIEALRAFYLGDAEGAESRFHIWDRGEAVGDSVTPSTYSRPYQLWMCDLLRKFLDDGDAPALLSVGCGNAVIESELTAAGYKVLGVDALEEAVQLARGKGVDAVCADILSWTPPESTQWTVVYADGILGHVFDQDHGVQHVLSRFRSWLPDGKGVLVMSNDEPRTDTHVQAHSEVPGFSWLSGPFLHTQAEAAGFQDVWTTWFTYDRPLSGSRERVVVTART
ncbi:MAG TPA: methyltransferase domain-containing protein [Streptosporangiaceae bacterium]|nr:methyltransferase domain-containing protein [Streptosporangiaceae bacterium]